MSYSTKCSLVILSIFGAWNQLVAETQADLRVSKPLTPILGSVANLPWARIGLDYAVSRELIIGLAHDFGPDRGTLETQGGTLNGGIYSDKILSKGYMHSSTAHVQVFPFDAIPVYSTLFFGVTSGLHAETRSLMISQGNSGPMATWSLGTMDMKSDRFWGLGVGYRYLASTGVAFGAELGVSRESVRMNVNTAFVSGWEPGVASLVSLRLNEDTLRHEAINDGTIHLPRLVLYVGVSM